MKTILVFCLVLVTVYGFPAFYPDSEEDSDEKTFAVSPFSHRVKFNPAAVSVTVGDSEEDSFYPSFFRPVFVNPFAGFRFNPFADFFSRPTWFDSLTPRINPWTKVKNATSTTKVVDGHKIIVNDTIYENEKDGAVFRFQVVEVRPSSPDSAEAEDKDGKKDEDINNNNGTESTDKPESEEAETPKPDNNSQDNEIHREELTEAPEEIISTTTTSTQSPTIVEPDIEIFETFDNRDTYQKVIDLSGDIKVNQIMSDQAQQLVMVHPDVELIDVPEVAETQKQEFVEVLLPVSKSRTEPEIPQDPLRFG